MQSNVTLVPDDAVIIRAAAAARAVRRHGNVKAAAAALGVEHTKLWRFLRREGYALVHEVRPTRKVATKKASK